MNGLGLVVRSLRHYWRTNLAVLLGVVAGTAVIGGAFVVGDSVRDSLAEMSLQRLGGVDHALHGVRFFREELAEEIGKADGFDERFERVAPLIVVTGSFVHEAESGSRRVSQVTVYGVDERAWGLLDHADAAVPREDERRRSTDPNYRSPVVLNGRVAGSDGLGVSTGDDVSLILEIPETIPGESLFGKTQGATTRLELSVSDVLPPEVPASRLSLQPAQQLPLVAFVGLDRLQRALEINAVESRTGEVESPARVNALFVRARDESDRAGPTAEEASARLGEYVQSAWAPADLDLHVRPYPSSGYVAVESDAMILDDATARAAESVAESDGRAFSTVLVYLANQFDRGRDEEPYSRYGVVAGIDLAAEPPFGPYAFTGDPPSVPLKADQIVVNDWLATDLELSVGDRLNLSYQPVGAYGDEPPDYADFEVVGVMPLEDADGEPTRAADAGVVPVVPGITDVETYDDWNEPYWMEKENKEVTPRDDEYWDRFRATPKAFVSLERARELWRSRYGGQTSVRIATKPGETVNRAAEEVEELLLATLEPAEVGFGFLPVKRIGVLAAAGTTSFSGLFIGFSFFLIAAATILIVLLFRLGIERRVREIGLLEAVGCSPASVRRLFLVEGLVVVVVGALIGSAAAVGYAWVMVYGLKTWWSGAIGTRFLFVSVHPGSLAIGFAISVTVTAGAIWWSFRGLSGLSARSLLAGNMETSGTATALTGPRWGVKVGRSAGLVALLVTVGLLSGFVSDDVEAFGGFSWRIVGFFLVGTLLLVSSLSEFAALLRSQRGTAVKGSGPAGVARLGERNASRHRQRSVFTTGLIASATFVIVAVAAGRQNLATTKPDVNSGNGGFLLVAETDRGVQFDLNTPEGRAAVGFEGLSEDQEKLLEDVLVAPFRMKPGQDASCLNLYQSRLPTMLGATPATIDRGGFAFADTGGENPWTLLDEPLPDEDGVPVYPVLGDMNTLQYSLHVGIGQTVDVPTDEEPEYKLKVMGQFGGSVFQGVLVLSEENFERLYPEQAGYRYFLVGGKERDGSLVPESRAEELSSLLETELLTYGFDAEPIGRRLNAFLAVQNTYLETFRTLGGLGLLLGTLGLATVMLRNVVERRSELALLRAVGFDDPSVAWMVLVENAYLLTWGLVAGTVSALVAMLPQLRSTSADVPWGGVLALLGVVFLVGMLAALWAVRAAVRTPIVGTLRAE